MKRGQAYVCIKEPEQQCNTLCEPGRRRSCAAQGEQDLPQGGLISQGVCPLQTHLWALTDIILLN